MEINFSKQLNKYSILRIIAGIIIGFILIFIFLLLEDYSRHKYYLYNNLKLDLGDPIQTGLDKTHKHTFAINSEYKVHYGKYNNINNYRCYNKDIDVLCFIRNNTSILAFSINNNYEICKTLKTSLDRTNSSCVKLIKDIITVNISWQDFLRNFGDIEIYSKKLISNQVLIGQARRKLLFRGKDYLILATIEKSYGKSKEYWNLRIYTEDDSHILILTKIVSELKIKAFIKNLILRKNS